VRFTLEKPRTQSIEQVFLALQRGWASCEGAQGWWCVPMSLSLSSLSTLANTLSGALPFVRSNVPQVNIVACHGTSCFAYTNHGKSFSCSQNAKMQSGEGTFCSLCCTSLSTFRRCVNPWDKTRTCGGSSGGEAALIAMGMALISTDG
jgi:hypothetical protein